MNPIFNVTLPYKRRCELPDCRKPSNQVFKINVEGNSISTCSPAHARTAESRWEEKKRLNVRLGVPVETNDDQVGDNIDEVG